MRILILRFSSFGDIFQALEAARHLNESSRSPSVDWMTREDFAPLLLNQKFISKIHAFPRGGSVFELIRQVWKIAADYDHVYDAHSNLRSFIVRFVIRLKWLLLRLKHPLAPRRRIVRRSKERLRRFLFFKFRWNTLPVPYRGAESFLLPLRNWIPNLEFNFSSPSWTPPSEQSSNPVLLDFFKWRSENPGGELIALAPSAAWPNKRWPMERWRFFVLEWMKESPDTRFLLLGGPDDKFLNEIEKEFGSSRVFSAVGKTSLLDSATLLSHATAVVANDTGLLHVADRLHTPSVVIIGPTAFGYPVAPFSRIAEVSNLPCKPCSKDGRDPCTNQVKLKCLLDVSEKQVAMKLREAFQAKTESRNLV